MKLIKITIKNKDTGKIYTLHEPWFSGFEYSWSEGNYSCDCNRSIFCGKSYEDSSVSPCGESRYRIIDCDIKELIEI